jgi:hypothetical protein
MLPDASATSTPSFARSRIPAPDVRTPPVCSGSLGLEERAAVAIVEVGTLDAGREAADETRVKLSSRHPTIRPASSYDLRQALIPVVSCRISLKRHLGSAAAPVVPSLAVSADAARSSPTARRGTPAWSGGSSFARADRSVPGGPAGSPRRRRGCDGVVSGDAAAGRTRRTLAAPPAREPHRRRLAHARFADAVPLGLAPVVIVPVDLTTTAAPAAQRFPHRYQAANAARAGPYAEGTTPASCCTSQGTPPPERRFRRGHCRDRTPRRARGHLRVTSRATVDHRRAYVRTGRAGG